MPFINGRFYLNPTYGRALESSRTEQRTSDLRSDGAEGNWVTIDHRHVFIREARSRIAMIARKYNGVELGRTQREKTTSDRTQISAISSSMT